MGYLTHLKFYVFLFLSNLIGGRKRIFLRRFCLLELVLVKVTDGSQTGVSGQLHLEDGRGRGWLSRPHSPQLLVLEGLDSLQQTLDLLLHLDLLSTRQNNLLFGLSPFQPVSLEVFYPVNKTLVLLLQLDVLGSGQSVSLARLCGFQCSLSQKFLLEAVSNQQLTGNFSNGGGGHVVQAMVFSQRLEREEEFLSPR